MALLFLKSAFFPNTKTKNYSLLPNEHDSSRESSFESSSRNEALNEKLNDRNGSSKTKSWKIDPRIISDATIGLSDGLTVPFALTAGLSALGDTNVVIYGGLAELIAGGISMGLGGYLGARSESQAYDAALTETKQLVINERVQAHDLVKESLASFNLSDQTLEAVAQELGQNESEMQNFLMRFHHQLPESASEASRAYVSALTISGGYFFGGLLPLIPYFLAATNHIAFLWSVGIMAFVLFVFGYVKTMLLGEGQKWTCFVSGVQMLICGGVAAAAAVVCVKAIAGTGD